MGSSLFRLILGLIVVNYVSSECMFFMAVGENVVSPSRAERESFQCKGDYGARVGCRLRIRCEQGKSSGEPGYYFEDDPEGDGIEVTCEGESWKTETGSSAIPSCKKGCIELTAKDMENATYVGGAPQKVYKNGYQTYWAQNTIIKTVCKPGFLFTTPELRKVGEDSHECSGTSGSGWKDLITNKPYGWPGKCEAVCAPIDMRDVPNNVEQTNDPDNDINSYQVVDGKKVMIPGSVYQYKCKPGSKYAPPHDKNQMQSISCVGGPGQWLDEATGKNGAKPVACISDGCPALTSSSIDSNANVEYGSNCAGSVKGEGCTVTIKCNKNAGGQNGLGYYMPGNPTGQSLTCKGGKWVDESQNAVQPNSDGRYGNTCSAGCAQLSNDEQARTNVVKAPTQSYVNDDVQFYGVGSTMETSCKDNTIRPGFTSQPTAGDSYQCTATGWKNSNPAQSGNGNDNPGTCLPACEVPNPLPEGTKVSISGAVTSKGGRSYVRDGATVSVTCDNEYKAPDGVGAPSQSLVCVGGSSGWKDSGSGQTNKAVMTCVRDGAAGCELVNPQSSPNTEMTTEGDCTPVDGLVPENCKLTIKCKEGFIPDSSSPSGGSDGKQTLTCKAGHDGYYDDESGDKNVVPLKCVAGCVVEDSMTAAEYTTPPNSADKISYAGKQYLRKNAQVSIKCKTPGFDFNNAEDRNAGNPVIDYKCLGGDDKYMKTKSFTFNKMPGDACGGVCPAIQTNPASGVVAQPQYALNSVTYTENSKRMVVNMEYKVKCQTGYEYPKDSPEAERGYQRIKCSGGTDGYVDLDTYKKNIQPTACIKSEAPRCTAIDHTQTNTAVEVEVGNCTTSSAKTTLGCEKVVTCKEGSYPVVTTKGSSSKQTIKCVQQDNGEAKWVDINTNKPAEELKCESGCLPIEPSENAIIVNEPAPTLAGGAAYHKQGTTVTIRCKPGYIPRSDSGMSSSSAGQNMDYTCNAAIPSKPWRNNLAQRFEEYPGSICVKPCPALSANGEGVQMTSSPQEVTTTSGRIVSGGSTYVFKCMIGYHYPDAKDDQNREQELYCNPETGTYQDKNNNNADVQTPTACKKDVGPGCKDLQKVNSQLVMTNCDKGYQQGCSVTVQCKEGYIPSDSKFYSTGKQKLSCPDGNDWVDEKGHVVSTTSTMICEPACKFDGTTVADNVVINRNSSRTVTVNNQVFMRESDYVTIKCNGDGVIWKNDVSSTEVSQEFECKGGDQKYKRAEDNAVEVIIGEGCIGTCKPPSMQLHDTLKMTKPEYFHYNGEDLVADGDQFTFQCRERYVYPDGSAPKTTGAEIVKCNGATRQLVYAATGAPFTQPTACVRSPFLNECEAINQDNSKTITSSPSCVLTNGKYYQTGCKINVKCKAGFMPKSDDYLVPTGEQQLSCGSGGEGWKDQNGKKITTQLECIEGCREQDTTHVTNHILNTKYTWKGILATCKEIKNQTTTSNSNNVHPYLCPKKEKGYYDDSCTNACRKIPAVLPQGVEVAKLPEPPHLDEGIEYIFGGTEYVLKCSAGYTYPANDPHKKDGRQTLRCNGATNKYDDADTGVSSAEISSCEEAKGCKALATSSYHVEPTQLNTCYKTGDYYSGDCQLRYGCGPGYYPENTEYLYGNGQKITCSEKDEAWMNEKNSPVTELLKCVPGCAKIEHRTIYELLNKTNVNVGVDMFLDSANKEHICFSVETERLVSEVITRIYKDNNLYFCGGKETETTPGSGVAHTEVKNSCEDSCVALRTNALPEGVILKTDPPSFNPHGRVTYVGVGSSYVFTCKDGYEYNPNSPYAKGNKEQTFKCEESNKYLDTTTQSSATDIAPCQKIPSCKKPAENSVTYSGLNCISTGSGYRSGCVLVASCVDDSYPTKESWRTKTSQKIECVSDPITGSIWKDVDTNLPAEHLSCTPGCLELETLNTNTNHSSSDERRGINGVFAVCSIKKSFETIIKELPAGRRRYYCNSDTGSNDGSSVTISPCTNSCEDPTIDESLKVNYPFGLSVRFPPPFERYSVIGMLMRVSCLTGKFEGTNEITMQYICSPDKKWVVRGTTQEVTSIPNTCK